MHALNTRIRLSQALAVAGLIVALVLLTHHVPRRLVEAELGVPMLLLAYSAAPLVQLGRRAQCVEPLAPLIAIVGADGSGKSTLSADVELLLGAGRPVARRYLGLGSGELGLRIARLPLIGAPVARLLTRKAGQTRDKEKSIPGIATALVVFAFSLLRLWRFRRVLSLRRRGVTVITDRYPQIEVAGFYDGPGLSAARAAGPLVAWLAARERRLYAWMASYRPDIVVRLNVDLATASLRKPDHDRVLLGRKVAVTPELRFSGARIVDIDASADYAEVRRDALSRIAPVLAQTDRATANA